MKRLLLRFLRPLCAIEGTGLGPALNASGIQSSSKDVVANTRKVLNTTATNQHDAVFLKVVALTRYVCIDLFLVGEPDTRYLTHSGIRLFRCGRIDTHTNTAPLRASIQRARFALFDNNLASFAD